MLLKNIVQLFDYTVAIGISQWVFLVDEFWWVWGIAGGFCFITSALLNKSFFGALAFLGFMLSVAIQPFFYFFSEKLTSKYLTQIYSMELDSIYAYIAGFIVAGVIWFYILRQFISWFDGTKHWFTKKTDLERDTRTDIRDVDKQLPNAKKLFNPERHFKKTGKIFCGINGHNRPVYIPTQNWRSSHVDLVGTTGSGKGVAAGVMLTQAIYQGEAAIVIDPKNDEFLPHVMGQAAEMAGVPFYHIDLMGQTPQWNPFGDKSQFEIEELFAAGFGQADKGSDADFYRLKDRAAARAFASEMMQNPQKLPKVYAALLQTQEDLLRESPKFQEDLEEIASMPVVNISKGIDIRAAIEQGAVIYVRGSMRNPRVLKLQKMFVLSVMQYCENRDRDKARHVCLFLDEFKYLISKPALEALGAIRDKRAHVILAHQSLGDLRDCPNDIDSQSVISSINENCLLKLAYKVNDPDTSDWLARMSGQILVDDETRTFTTSTGMIELREPERKLRQTERCLIDTNMLQSLPKGCAVLFGNGLADFVFTSPIKVKKRAKYTLPSIFNDAEDPRAANNLVKDVQSKQRTIVEELVNVD